MIPNGSWACFTDGDAMFTTPNFGHQLEEVIKANPEYDLFSCMTNRVGTNYQLIGSWTENSMHEHRELGKFLSNSRRTEVIDITNEAPISGVLMLVRKSAWFTSKRFKETGLLGVDNSIHYAMAAQDSKVGLMRGVYVMHYYRNGNKNDKSHLQ
jgi:hypothetical protein